MDRISQINDSEKSREMDEFLSFELREGTVCSGRARVNIFRDEAGLLWDRRRFQENR